MCPCPSSISVKIINPSDNFHSASISVKLMQEMAGATVIGPILSGIDKPIQICSTVSTVNDILNMAVIAACKVG